MRKLLRFRASCRGLVHSPAMGAIRNAGLVHSPAMGAIRSAELMHSPAIGAFAPKR